MVLILWGWTKEPHLCLPNREKFFSACYDRSERNKRVSNIFLLINYMHCWIENHELVYRSRIKSGNHPLCSAARIDQFQLREYLENRPRRGFAHVGVELGVPAQSAGHMRQNASVADPRFQRNRCGVFGLKIKCNWDGQPCRRARVNVAINKSSACQHSPR